MVGGGVVIFKVVVPPSVCLLVGWVVYVVAFVLVLLDQVGMGHVGLPSVVFWACAEESSQGRR